MPQFGGKDSKRHFTVVMGGKEHGLYVSSTPSSAAKKAVTKLCAANKSKKVEFHMREITQDSKKKTYGPYEGYIEKLKEPIELKGRVIKYKPVAKLSGKSGAKKGGMRGGGEIVLKDILNFGTYYALIVELNGRKYTYRLNQSYHNGQKYVNTRVDKEKNYFIYDETLKHNFGSLFELQPNFHNYVVDIKKRLEDNHTIIIKMTKDGSFRKLMDLEMYPEKSENFNYTVNRYSYINNQ
jgi:hypothetical protein